MEVQSAWAVFIGVLIAVVAAPSVGAAEFPVVDTSACASQCAPLASGQMPSDCVICLYSAGAVRNYSIPGFTCGGGDPAEYFWTCVRELSSPAAGASGSAAPALPAGVPPPPRLQRLPVYEAGLTSVPATPVLYPARFMPATAFSYKATKAMALSQNGINFQAGGTAWMGGGFAPKDVKMCPGGSCKTLDSGSDLDPVSGCVKKQGWTMPRGSQSVACEGAPAIDYTIANASLDTPEQLAMVFPSNRGRQAWMAAAQAEARAMLTDATAAADSLWQIAQTIFSSAFFFKNVTSDASNIARLKAIYGANWDVAWEDMSKAGTLVELDLMWLNGYAPAGDFGPGSWNVAAHALLKAVGAAKKGNLKLRVVALVLGNAGGSNKTEVYTPARSETAFIAAMMAMRATYNQHIIWFGHVFHYHQINGAIVYALYNSIEPDVAVGLATHPVRQLLDHYLDPSLPVQFLGYLFMPGTYVSSVRFGYTNTTTRHEQPGTCRRRLCRSCTCLASTTSTPRPIGRVTLHNTAPSQMLKWSGLDHKFFTQRASKPWGMYPAADLHLQMEAITSKLAKDALSRYYKTDTDVASDAALQAWVAAMADPKGGNLGDINGDGNRVVTRQALFDLVGRVMYATVAHGTAHLQDWFIRMLSLAHHPPVVSASALPPPNVTLSLSDIMAAAPNTHHYGRYAAFVFSFIGAPAFTQLVPGDLDQETGKARPKWADQPPFTTAGRPASERRRAAAANRAVVAFRRRLSAFLGDKRLSPAARTIKTGWGMPLTMPRVIHL
ncbi:MAG: hypothetical protein J3K34DRAFT_397774 [Monoraphidium minutum]|nr:MAG: hypothetical protein J3K34DRAFT_397774 [Monoraphidium minutum]